MNAAARHDVRSDLIQQNTDLTAEVHRLTKEVHALVSKLPTS